MVLIIIANVIVIIIILALTIAMIAGGPGLWHPCGQSARYRNLCEQA